jgi:hypothetical protein
MNFTQADFQRALTAVAAADRDRRGNRRWLLRYRREAALLGLRSAGLTLGTIAGLDGDHVLAWGFRATEPSLLRLRTPERVLEVPHAPPRRSESCPAYLLWRYVQAAGLIDRPQPIFCVIVDNAPTMSRMQPASLAASLRKWTRSESRCQQAEVDAKRSA